MLEAVRCACHLLGKCYCACHRVSILVQITHFCGRALRRCSISSDFFSTARSSSHFVDPVIVLEKVCDRGGVDGTGARRRRRDPRFPAMRSSLAHGRCGEQLRLACYGGLYVAVNAQLGRLIALASCATAINLEGDGHPRSLRLPR